MTEIVSPLQQFFDTSGAPLANGQIFIGTAGLDAQSNPIPVYWDEAFTIPAPQPIRTLNGYPVWNGAPARFYVSGDDYSIAVRNAQGRLMYPALSVIGSRPFTAGATMTGALGVIAGTAALPGVFVSGDTNTGLFQPFDNTLAVTVGGVEVARFGANGLQSASPWVDLASATTTDLGAQTSTNLRITGTATITSFGTAASGVRRELRFAAALTLTHGGSLILPGGANIVTAAGDTATAVSLGSGNWVIESYTRAAALSVLQGAITGSGLTMATARLLGRPTVGSGPIEEIPLGSGLSFAGGALQSSLRVWLSFNGIGTVAIRGSEGVTSITDNGVGDYTVNYNFTFPDTNYSAVSACAATGNLIVNIDSQATTNIRLGLRNGSNVFFDSSIVNLLIAR